MVTMTVLIKEQSSGSARSPDAHELGEIDNADLDADDSAADEDAARERDYDHSHDLFRYSDTSAIPDSQFTINSTGLEYIDDLVDRVDYTYSNNNSLSAAPHLNVTDEDKDEDEDLEDLSISSDGNDVTGRRDALDLEDIALNAQREVLHEMNQRSDDNNSNQKRLSLRLKHSSQWLHSIKRKASDVQMNQYLQPSAVEDDNSEQLLSKSPQQCSAKGKFTSKTSKRFSLASSTFLPKRFSTSFHGSTNPVKLSPPPEEVNLVDQVPNIIHEQSLNPMAPLSPTRSLTGHSLKRSSRPTSPIQKSFNDPKLMRNASFGSSSMSEKSTIVRSIDMFKRTTKSILFIDSTNPPSSNSNNSNQSELYNNISSEIQPDGNEMPAIRRSISYTDADRMRLLSSTFMVNTARNDTIKSDSTTEPENENKDRNGDGDKNGGDSRTKSLNIPKRPSRISFTPVAMPLKAELNNLRSENKNTTIANPIHTTTSRQRSKTMDASGNPLTELAGVNTGILSSISNFVKINRTTPVTTTQTIPSRVKPMKLTFPKSSDDELSSQYLERLMKEFSLPHVAEILSLEDNDFMKQALQVYLKKYYDFDGEPLDISLRKFLMLNYLPKETQQIDRLIYQFAQHYHDCHPELGLDHDTHYILTYSLIMAHTDKFNPNNKRKMTRFEFIQNVLGAIESNRSKGDDNSSQRTEHLKEILGYLFDNITYCPLIKISEEQSEAAMAALESPDIPLPYPLQSFLNNGVSSRGSDDYRKTSISSAMSVTANTSGSSLNHSNSQVVLQVPAPTRKKSSSFLWSAPTLVDPYEYIIKRSIHSLDNIKLLMPHAADFQLSCKIPFLSADDGIDCSNDVENELPSLNMIESQLDDYIKKIDKEIDYEMLQALWSSLTNSKIDFTLKIHKSKASYLESSKVEIKELNNSTSEEEYYLTRVIKVGIIEKQEVSFRKTTTSVLVPTPDITDVQITNVGMDLPRVPAASVDEKVKNANKIWKPYFCILTTVGMFFYENVALFRMRFCGTNKETGSNMVIIEEASSTGDAHATRLATAEDTSDNTGFLSFPYFRTSKSEKEREKVEKEKHRVEQNNMLPSFIITSECFAARKIQNLEYDSVVNDIVPITSIDTKVTTTTNNNADANLGTAGKAYETLPGILERRESETNMETVSNHDPKAKSQPLKYTFFIYGKDSKNIFMVSSLEEVKSWIHSINIVSAVSNVKIPAKPLDFRLIPKDWKQRLLLNHSEPKYYEMVPKRRQSMKRSFNSEIIDAYSNEVHNPSYTTRGRSKTSTSRRSPLPETDIVIRSDGTPQPETSSSEEIEDMDDVDVDDEDQDRDRLSDYSDARGRTLGSDYRNSIVQNFEGLRISGSMIPSCRSFSPEVKDEINLDTGSSVDSLSTDISCESDTLPTHKHSSTELLNNLYGVKQLLITTPLDRKTREELISAAKIIGVKLEWLWYEQCKERTFELILRRINELCE